MGWLGVVAVQDLKLEFFSLIETHVGGLVDVLFEYLLYCWALC